MLAAECIYTGQFKCFEDFVTLRFQWLKYENSHKTCVKHLKCKLYYQQQYLKYLCNLASYWLQFPWGWHYSVETCRSVIFCEIIVHLSVTVQNRKKATFPVHGQLILISFARISFDFQSVSQYVKHVVIWGWRTEQRSTNRVAWLWNSGRTVEGWQLVSYGAITSQNIPASRIYMSWPRKTKHTHTTKRW